MSMMRKPLQKGRFVGSVPEGINFAIANGEGVLLYCGCSVERWMSL